MTLTIPLTPDEELRLREKARAEGLTPEQVVHQAIQPILESDQHGVKTGREKADAFRQWAESFPAGLPILSLEEISRENIYRRE